MFRKRDINIVSIHHCPHAPEEQCACRKPKTGMIDEVLRQEKIDLKHSWMIGDKQSDIDLAVNANIGNTVAIGERDIVNSTFSFRTILECQRYLEENEAIIQS